MNDDLDEDGDARPASWAGTVESIGCGLILALFLLAVIGICAWAGHR